jgi:hypothetical protein
MTVRILSLVAVSTMAACSSQLSSPSEAKQGGDLAAPARPVIAKLVFRDVDLVILSGSDGPRFSIDDKLGAPLARELADGDLAARYPEIYQVYRSAFVQRHGPYLDATFSPPREEPGSR